jgi:hypothetical protein
MEKKVITTTGNYVFDCPLGRTFTIAASGASTLALAAQYTTAPGVFTSHVPAVALSANGIVSGINVGAHTEINVAVTTLTGASCTLIFNVVPA